MTATDSVEILKSAILLEKRGRAFYGQVAKQASHPEVKRFFEMMADEEAQHIAILTDQFKAYRESTRFTPVAPPAADDIADKVLTDELVNAIAAADYDWLSRWEQSHLRFLSEVDREITERIWHDNHFWSF